MSRSSLWLYLILAFLTSISQAAQLAFLEAPAYGVGSQPHAIVVGDFNGDGNADLAVADLDGDRVSLLLGNGMGRFQPKMDFPTGAQPSGIVAGDCNGDGKLDVAVSDLSGQISVLLGNGDGTLQGHVEYRAGNSPSAITLADFNGDGQLDLAVTNSLSSTISVLLGNGDGSFRPQMMILVGVNPRSLTAGDFNHDGQSDLAVVNHDSGTTSILLGNGDGTFQPHVDFFSGVQSAFVWAADLNGDAILDLVITNLFANNAGVFLGQGDGTFQMQASFGDELSFGAAAVATGDFNSDGKPDLVITNYGSRGDGVTVGLAFGDGAGGFGIFHDYGVGNGPLALAAADFNHDGKLDLAVVEEVGNSVSVLMGDGNGRLQARPEFNLKYGGTILAVDLNRDGKRDLLAGQYGAVSVLLGKGNGSFQPQRRYPLLVTGGYLGIAAADFNEDGVPDVALANVSLDSVSILLGNGDGSFQSDVEYGAGSGPAAVAGDFNGDSHLDLAVGDEALNSQGTVSVLLGNGDGSFQPAVPYDAVSYVFSVVAGDFNHDGKLDLIAGNFGYPDRDNTVSILLGNGDGTFQPHVEFSVIGTPEALATGDFNRDGNLDLAVAAGDGVTVVLGNGDGSFQAGHRLPPLGASAVAVADVNGDGFLDIVTGTLSTQSVAVLLGNGDGTFRNPLYFAIGGETGSLAIGNFTTDHALDVAVSFAYDTGISLLVNQGKH